MKTIPVDKVCKLCKQKKLLVHFGVDDKARDKRDRICKECRTSISSSDLCQGCVNERIIESSIPVSELLLDLAKGGIGLPRELLNNLAYILHLSGFKYLCDSCGKKEKREKRVRSSLIAKASLNVLTNGIVGGFQMTLNDGKVSFP
jgi:hypothetical protein